MTGTRGFVVSAGGGKTFRLTNTSMSPQSEKFLFVQSRKFRFAEAWRNAHRGAEDVGEGAGSTQGFACPCNIDLTVILGCHNACGVLAVIV